MCHHRYAEYEPADALEEVEVPDEEEADPEATVPADDD